MLYRNKNFWNSYGSKLISSLLQIENIFIEEKDILKFLETEEYKNQNSKDNKALISMCKSWEYIKHFIFNLKEHEQLGSGSKLSPQEFAKIYTILDESNEYSYLFDYKSETPFLEQLEYMNTKLYSIDDLEEIVDLLLSFSIEHTIENTLGYVTTYFLSYFIVAILIFKNFGPFITPAEEMQQVIELRMASIQDCAQELKSNWSKLESYQKLKDYLVNNSESFWANYPELCN